MLCLQTYLNLFVLFQALLCFFTLPCLLVMEADVKSTAEHYLCKTMSIQTEITILSPYKSSKPLFLQPLSLLELLTSAHDRSEAARHALAFGGR